MDLKGAVGARKGHNGGSTDEQSLPERRGHNDDSVSYTEFYSFLAKEGFTGEAEADVAREGGQGDGNLSVEETPVNPLTQEEEEAILINRYEMSPPPEKKEK